VWNSKPRRDFHAFQPALHAYGLPGNGGKGERAAPLDELVVTVGRIRKLVGNADLPIGDHRRNFSLSGA